MPTPPCILTIAGSDSGGGAGIQADLKTITVIGGFGMSVITALTAQNGVGVAGIHAPEPGFVGLQLKTVREGFPIAAAKTGMLFSAEIIEARLRKPERAAAPPRGCGQCLALAHSAQGRSPDAQPPRS